MEVIHFSKTSVLIYSVDPRRINLNMHLNTTTTTTKERASTQKMPDYRLSKVY